LGESAKNRQAKGTIISLTFHLENKTRHIVLFFPFGQRCEMVFKLKIACIGAGYVGGE
jgi:hypothetical protein